MNADALENAGPARLDRKDAAILALLVVLAGVILWPILAAPAGYAPGLPGEDGRTQWYPWREYGFGSIRDGTLPMWNPYVMCGVPFVGNFQSALFYPPNAVFLVAPVATAARLSIWFHVALSLVFAYLLARELGVGRAGATVCAMTFGFCAAQLLRVTAGHWGVSCAIPWLPLALLCAERIMRRPGRLVLIVGACAVGLQILSGMPQYVYITAVTVGAFAVIRGFGAGLTWRDRAWRWGLVAGMFALGAALSAIQLFPGIEAAGAGARSLPMRKEWAEVFSLGPECLWTLLVPRLFGGAGGQAYWGRWLFWEMNAYVGVVGLALAVFGVVCGRARRAAAGFGALALLALLLALGKHTPVMGLAGAVLPLSGMLRGAAKFLLPFSLSMAVLAGLGAEAMIAAKSRRDVGRLVVVAGLLAGVVLIIVLFREAFAGAVFRAVKAGGERLPFAGGVTPDLRALAVGGMVALGLLIGLAAVGIVLRRAKVAAGVVLVILVFADLSHFGRLFVRRDAVFAADGGAWPKQAGPLLRFLGGDGRTLAWGRRSMNDGMLAGVRTVEGIEPNPPARFHLLFRAGQGMPVDVAPSVYQLWLHAAQGSRGAATRGLYELAPGGRIAQQTSVGRVLCLRSSRPALRGARSVWESKDGEWELLELPSSVPRVQVVHESRVAKSPREAFEMTLATDLRKAVVLEEDSTPGAQGEGERETGVAIRMDRPNLIELEAKLERPGWLVLQDNDYPGWRAKVDGEDRPILRANFAFRAVALSPGKHVVTFIYRSSSLVAGFWMSAAAIVGCGGAVLLMVIRRRAREAR